MRRLGALFVVLVIAFVACKREQADPTAGCATDADCTTSTLGADCCSGCGPRPLTRAAERALIDRCNQEKRKCPQLDCPDPGRQVAACQQGHCVVHPAPR